METNISPIDELMDASSALYFLHKQLDKEPEDYGAAAVVGMIADKVRAVATFMDNEGWELHNWESLEKRKFPDVAKILAKQSASVGN